MDAAVILETVIAEESATDVTFNDGEKEAFMRVIQRPRGLRTQECLLPGKA